MSRITELEKQITELDERKVALQQELELEKLKEVECPFKYGDRYFLLPSDGIIANLPWEDYHFDKDALLQGHIFKTQQEAERERDRRALLTRFRQFRDKCNIDWKPTINEKKYYIFFNFEERKFKIDCYCQIGLFDLFGAFENEADCERAIELFGDEIKQLFLEEK